MTRAVPIDDHRLVELGLAALLTARGVEVVAIEHSLPAGIGAMVALRPDVVVCDVISGEEPPDKRLPSALAATRAAATPA